MILSTHINAESLIEALANLKNIPIAKVIRNASRDFAQASQKATPIANKSKSEFYYFWENGQKRFLHESQVGKVKRGSKLRKVRIHRGWSKASWMGIFRALGMSLRMSTNRLPQAVEHLSNAITSGTQTTAKTVMTDAIRFDRFGQSQDTRTDNIAREGFALAAKRIQKEVNNMLIKQWGNR